MNEHSCFFKWSAPYGVSQFSYGVSFKHALEMATRKKHWRLTEELATLYAAYVPVYTAVFLKFSAVLGSFQLFPSSSSRCLQLF